METSPIRRVVAGCCLTLVMTAGASAQVLGTFSWQTQPYCNLVSLRIEQFGGVLQLSGSDDQCGAGLAPVSGTALIGAGAVAFGFEVNLPSGRAAHISSTINLTTLGGSWADADGHTGAFTFAAASSGGSPRPAPFAASAITVAQLSSTVYAGSGVASTLSRSDHLHDDRYYTKSQSDTRFLSTASVLSAVISSAGALSRGTGVVSASRVGLGEYTVQFNRDVSACTYVGSAGQLVNSVIRNRNVGTAPEFGNANGVFITVDSDTGAAADSPFHLVVVCP